jgi:hypothetical protein
MKRYTFKDGTKVTSRLDSKEVIKRMNRLDTLRVLTEGYTDGEGASICKKAWRAYNKLNDFTGIIRLNNLEKDFLGYMLESDMLDNEDREVINYYLSR